MRQLTEDGFEMTVVKDATAGAKHPDLGDGYAVSVVNFGFIASAVVTTDEIVVSNGLNLAVASNKRAKLCQPVLPTGRIRSCWGGEAYGCWGFHESAPPTQTMVKPADFSSWLEAAARDPYYMTSRSKRMLIEQFL